MSTARSRSSTWGSGPPRPPRAPRNRTDVLLTLLVVRVFIGAACSAFTAWAVWDQARDTRELNCLYLTIGNDGEVREYDDLQDYEKAIADAQGCDIDGR